MAKMQDKRKLHKELQLFDGTAMDYKMTAMLLDIHGLKNAMSFVKSIKPKSQLKMDI